MGQRRTGRGDAGRGRRATDGSRADAGRGRRATGGGRRRTGGQRAGSGSNNAVVIVGVVLGGAALLLVAIIAMNSWGDDDAKVAPVDTVDTGNTGMGAARSGKDTGFGGSGGGFKRLDAAPWAEVSPLLLVCDQNRRAALSAREKGKEAEFKELMGRAWKNFRDAEHKVDDWQYKVGEENWDASFGKTYGQKMHKAIQKLRAYMSLEKN